MKKIPVIGSKEPAIVDNDMYEYLSQYIWQLALDDEGQEVIIRIWRNPVTGKDEAILMAEEIVAIDRARKTAEAN